MIDIGTAHADARKQLARRAGRYPLMPDLSEKAELALLCRLLFQEGYDDHIAGHITYRLSDDTFLVNPWELTWDEILPADVMHLSSDGEVLDGDWNITPALSIHLAIHKLRPDVNVIIHNHSRYGTLWADAHRIPPIYDQTAAQVDGEVTLIDYEATVDQAGAAEAAARAMGDAKWALLANHGVLVTARDIRQAHLRAITLEWRCRQAWCVEAMGGGAPMDDAAARAMGSAVDANGFPFLFEAMARRELRRDSRFAEAL